MSSNTIDAQAVLAQMRLLAARARGVDMPQAVSPIETGAHSVNFGDAMQNALEFVNTRQVEARNLTERFEQGDKNVDVAQVMVAMQKASLSFQAATQVRNKLVSAYQDIMNMPL
ncbi:MAG: flagellar hook-basal body complex protein FliE [Gammaproteobacteria bacterium]|jgi:flagellar hook-basal body complex protein FliE|nr:flagellar hook-basal body complex protein FliE [Gammaproteobacteria bacterium]